MINLSVKHLVFMHLIISFNNFTFNYTFPIFRYYSTFVLFYTTYTCIKILPSINVFLYALIENALSKPLCKILYVLSYSVTLTLDIVDLWIYNKYNKGKYFIKCMFNTWKYLSLLT